MRSGHVVVGDVLMEHSGPFIDLASVAAGALVVAAHFHDAAEH